MFGCVPRAVFCGVRCRHSAAAAVEAVLVGLLLSDRYWLWSLLAVATLGSVLGSVVNWWLGRGIERFRDRRWFPVSARHLEKPVCHYQRYGHWSLLLSWLPVIGDPLTLVAGVMREPLGRFLLIVTLAKGARYGAVGRWPPWAGWVEP